MNLLSLRNNYSIRNNTPQKINPNFKALNKYTKIPYSAAHNCGKTDVFVKTGITNFCKEKTQTNYILNAINKMIEHINKGSRLTQKDEIWLEPLRQTQGANKVVINNLDNPKEEIEVDCHLTIEDINKNPEAFVNALKTLSASSSYQPNIVNIDNQNYIVHNKTIANIIRADYTPESLGKIKEYLEQNNVFDMSDSHEYGLIIDNERGIAKTCGASENWEMSERAWITDTLRVGDLQKEKRPETWTKALNTLGKYYQTQDTKFKELINNPALYREGDAMQGIPHIFMPKTLEPDKDWFNNKRLESHGLALKEFCIAIIDGFTKNADYGYQSSKDIPNDIILAIDNLSKYFKAIDYTTAPSAGNWEEIPMKGGLTSDTESIRSAFSAYKDLLYNDEYSSNLNIIDIRNRLSKLNPISEKDLTDLISQGESRVRATYLEEAPKVRPHDASLSFVTTSDIKLSDDIIEDVNKHVEILETLEKNLVRENGIIRYSPFNFVLKDGTVAKTPDSYLNQNYFVAIDKNGKLNLKWKEILDSFGSKDCSDPDMFNARAKLSIPDREAHWFMVSEMSTGYGKQIEKLYKNAKNNKRSLNNEEQILVTKLKKKQAEFLNRALARLSAENPEKINQLKANGLPMPRVTLPEAYQYVSKIDGGAEMLPGTNAPLAWALASLYKAMKQEEITLELSQKI